MRSCLAVGLLLAAGSAQADGFRFDGAKAARITKPHHYVQIGERMSVPLLKKRMPEANVELVRSDCGGVCAIVKTGVGSSLYVAWGLTRGGGIYLISSEAKGSRDLSGITLGSSLKAAVGAKVECDEGEQITCRSGRIAGLSYLTGGCPIQGGPPPARYVIPACATVAGFQIYR